MPELSEERRWTAADVNVVELLAFGFGILLASVLAIAGWLWDQPAMIVGPGIGGLAVTIRAIAQARRRPWWKHGEHP